MNKERKMKRKWKNMPRNPLPCRYARQRNLLPCILRQLTAKGCTHGNGSSFAVHDASPCALFLFCRDKFVVVRSLLILPCIVALPCASSHFAVHPLVALRPSVSARQSRLCRADSARQSSAARGGFFP